MLIHGADVQGLLSTRLTHAQLRAHIAAKFRAPVGDDTDQLMHRQNVVSFA